MGQAPADVPPVQDGIEATSNVDGGTHISLVEKSVGSPEGGIPNLDFAGPNDPANPQNWSKIYKSTHLALVSYMAFIVCLGDACFAPSLPLLLDEFHTSTLSPLSAFVVTVYIIGCLFGNLALASLSESWGRSVVLHASNSAFVIFAIVCAASTNLGMFIAFRFFDGVAGSVCLTLGSPIVGDLFIQEQRGRMMAIFSIGQLIGPIAGPVVGGLISQAKGWRWVFWLIAIAMGAALGPAFFVMRETYKPVILSRKMKTTEKGSGKDPGKDTSQSALRREMLQACIIRPTKMFLFAPVVTILSIHVGITVGFLYILITRLNIIYQYEYRFSQELIGLTYVGAGIGLICGLTFCGLVSDSWMKSLAGEGELRPELRLPPMIVGALFVPVGLVVFGWTAEYHTHWIFPILGTGFFGFGVMTTILPTQTYLVDGYPLYAASALAVVEVTQSVAGGLFPLAGPSLYNNLGLGWGNSILAFIALVFAPVPVILLIYGERIRHTKKFQVKL